MPASPLLPPLLPLNDGHSIPQLGFGVYKVPAEETEVAVRRALDAGYRHIDTAALYRNEDGVGRALHGSDLAREEVFVTSKVWNDRHGHDETLLAFDETLELLGLDYLDLYLIHWPVPSQDRYVDTWRALVELRDSGRVRSIGVSNFEPAHLDRLVAETGVVPAINQVELHPWLQQSEVRAKDAGLGIVTESWAPLARGRAATDPVIVSIAERNGITPAQVVLRWHLDSGLVAIPKTVTPARMAENLAALEVALDDEDRAVIAALDSNGRTGLDPNAG